MPLLHFVLFVFFFYFRNDENVADPHKIHKAQAKGIRLHEIQAHPQRTYIDDSPKYIERLQPPPPSKPPPTLEPALFFQTLRTGGAAVGDSSEDRKFPYANALQRSATLPAKHNRLGARSRVTFKVPQPAAPTAPQLESSNNVALPKEANKMTSEDLLQPGHVVKERWKVRLKEGERDSFSIQASLLYSLLLLLHLLRFRLCAKLVAAVSVRFMRAKILLPANKLRLRWSPPVNPNRYSKWR